MTMVSARMLAAASGRLVASLAVAGAALLASAQFTSAQAQTPRPRLDNVFALQALIDFDTLEQAQYDPAKKTLALFGRRTQGGRVIRVLYLDLLATAIEADAPTLTLTWLPESRRDLEAARTNSAFFEIFEPGSRRINKLGAWLFEQGGVKVAAGSQIDDVGEAVERKGGLARIFAGKGPIHVPPELVSLAFKAVPRVRPVVKGMPPRSLLANIALDADIRSKLVGESPELKGKVAGYMPFSEWERTRGEAGGEQHTWISPGKFEVQESPDGRTMRFLRTPMQFNIQKYVAGKSTPDPILTGYAQLLTSRYDALAEHFSALHELRECAKIMAVADWLKRRGWKVSFPREGRVDVPMPSEIAGIVHMNINVNVTSSSGLSIKSVMWQTGGIDLGLKPFVWPTPSLESLPVIPPMDEANTALKRVASSLDKIHVPSPAVAMPGWYAQARAGEKALKYVALHTDLLAKGKGSPEALAKLEQIRRRAAALAAYDQVLNDMKKTGVPNLAELERLSKWGKDAYWDHLNDMWQFATSMGLAYAEIFKGFKPSAGLKEADSWRTFAGDVKATADRFASMKDRDSKPSELEYFADRGTELGLKLSEMFTKDVLLSGKPIMEPLVDAAFTRAKATATMAFGLYGFGKRYIDVRAALLDAVHRDALSTRALLDGDKVRAARAEVIRKLADDVKAYEAMTR